MILLPLVFPALGYQAWVSYEKDYKFVYRPIKAGEELFADYKIIKGPPPNDYPWYFELKSKIEEEDRIQVSML